MNEPGAEATICPVVGIGASAGGLEALKEFFGAVPPDSGMAYVIILHLAPDRESSVAGLLNNVTPISVEEAADGTRIEPDHAYVVAPGHDMRLENGLLRLAESRREGRPLVVDTFLDSLAQELGSLAAAVILSGTGTDGSNGIKKIKAGEGVVIVQSPESAGYAGMPRSAIETGVVDMAATAAEIPGKLQHHFLGERFGEERVEEEEYALSKVFAILRHQLGHDFSGHKESTLRRRMQRRMVLNDVEGYDEYIRLLRQNRQEAQALFREFLIGVTHFFRDPETFVVLKEQVFPQMLEEIGEEEALRVWVAGCSTGEEAYSLAITLQEAVDEQQKSIKFKIFATDLDERAVETARRGVYPSSIAADVEEARLKRFFHRDGNFYRVRKAIRESIIFSVQDLLSDPPFSRLDMVCCRNVLIYLKPREQKRLVPLFHYTLNGGGVLVLGSSENVGGNTALFAVVDQAQKVFRKKEVSAQVRGELQFPTGIGRLEREPSGRPETQEGRTGGASPGELAQQLLLEEFAPTALLVEPDGRIIHIQGKTGKYLEAATGPPTSNVVDLAREGLRLELASALRAVRTGNETVVRRGVGVKNRDSQERVDIVLRPLSKPDELAGRVLIVFRDREEPEVGRKGSPAEGEHSEEERQRRVAELEAELQKTRESHQSTVEELETANEELKSTNEELQSANEELQSTNEEHESFQEELQAVNEELRTSNEQLEAKNEELRAVNDDVRNLLNSTEVGSVFLDEELKVRRFTPEATKLIHLIDSDIGRPLAHLGTELEYQGLLEDVRRASEDLETQEKDVRTEEGSWYRMRIVPYRTSDNRIAGAVLTFFNIDEQKRAQAALKKAGAEAQERLTGLREVAEMVDAPLAVLDPEQRVLLGNDAFARLQGRAAAELEGVSFPELLAGEQREKVSETLREGAEGAKPFDIGPVRFEVAGELSLFGTPLRERQAGPGHLLIRSTPEKDV